MRTYFLSYKMTDLTKIILKEHLSVEDKEVLLKEIAQMYLKYVQNWTESGENRCVNGGEYVLRYNPLTQKSMDKGPFIRLYTEWRQENQTVSLPTFKFHVYLASYLPEELRDEVAIWEAVPGPSG